MDILLSTIQIMRKPAATILCITLSNKQQRIFYMHHLTVHTVVSETRNSSAGLVRGIDLMTHHTMSGCCTTELHLIPHVFDIYPCISVPAEDVTVPDLPGVGR